MTGREHEGGVSPLYPELPFEMAPRARRALADTTLQGFINTATRFRDVKRLEAFRSAFGDRAGAVRALAGRIKQHTLDHLDVYLGLFIDRATQAGMTLHFAEDAARANGICVAIAREYGCKLCVKSKSMVTEEIGLVPALQGIGVETVETDLGEFILQLDGDAPSHIVTPMIHKNRVSVAKAFTRVLGAEYTEAPEQLTAIARRHMRSKFRQADLGVSGANFLVADTGSVVLCTNEGNADLSVGAPRVHVVLAGIEKLIPSRKHLGVFLKILGRSATAQPMTVYTTMINGPRRSVEHDGPDAVHVVLVDNGRTELLRTSTRELLRCIRCGACLNACPVYRKAGGGHAYGSVYSGPIGSALTPWLKGVENYPDLPHVTSLCGACHEACPVEIDLPAQLIHLRATMVDRMIGTWAERLLFRLWAMCLKDPTWYRAACAVQRRILRTLGRDPGSGGGIEDRKWVRRLPPPLGAWTAHHDLPTPTSCSFRDWWRRRGRELTP